MAKLIESIRRLFKAIIVFFLTSVILVSLLTGFVSSLWDSTTLTIQIFLENTFESMTTFFRGPRGIVTLVLALVAGLKAAGTYIHWNWISLNFRWQIGLYILALSGLLYVFSPMIALNRLLEITIIGSLTLIGTYWIVKQSGILN